jgi:hypothetical protein
MATFKLLAFILVCVPSMFAASGARNQSPIRTATGDEIWAAVQQAERELAEVRAKRPPQPANHSALASALPY